MLIGEQFVIQSLKNAGVLKPGFAERCRLKTPFSVKNLIPSVRRSTALHIRILLRHNISL